MCEEGARNLQPFSEANWMQGRKSNSADFSRQTGRNTLMCLTEAFYSVFGSLSWPINSGGISECVLGFGTDTVVVKMLEAKGKRFL